MSQRYLDYVRGQIIGSDLLLETPFGPRHMVYADYTASGRGLHFIEEKLIRIQRSYANTHTEDDFSGKRMTRLYHQALTRIKEMVNAGEHGRVFPVGAGSTGALKKLQEIIGVYIPPLTRERLDRCCSEAGRGGRDVRGRIETSRPVVFIGPYEHHTNELMWREALAETVVIRLSREGGLDLDDLERKISESRFKSRLKFGSFSAGSNITGVRTPVYEVARICHRHDTAVFFDFAAVAPYVPIDMNKDRDAFFDAVFFSPHKFLGGPGSSGVLVINDRLYRRDLPPTTAGGGTVVYVGFDGHDYDEDIETREMAGTPPILQTIKAALAMEIKERIGPDAIEKMERENLAVFLERLQEIPNLRFIGRYDVPDLTPIVSFNITHRDRILHPKFVTKLLNDLFGIQSRAGCSCAGPYGHALLNIGEETSRRLRDAVARGFQGIKPGWVRINLHYTFSRSDIDFLARAIAFTARHGHLFLRLYNFDLTTGEWRYRGFTEAGPDLSLDADFRTASVHPGRLRSLRASYFREARRLALELERAGEMPFQQDDANLESLKYFYYAHG
ncbi:MAG: aminotransferase class V-fold PLP-dependent enzyme, partial [Candidatus Aminicenantes bacterium]|nr:aminotransferase class V-fold PLP-dependent enzyme [Candidatus Aminicenantes bacterium]